MSHGDIIMAVPIKIPRAARKELVTLGENIRVARLRRKLTAEIVAQRAGTTRQGIVRLFCIGVLMRLCSRYAVSALV